MGGRARAVEYRDDDDEHDSVGCSELGEIGGFRDPAETVGGGNGNGGLCSFSVSSLSLISIAGEAMGVTEDNNSKYEEEQY